MSEQNNCLIGDSKESKQLLFKILPLIESMMLKANKDFYTIKETMEILSISRTQLYYLRVKGLMECKHVGRKVYITKEAIHKLVMSNGTTVDSVLDYISEQSSDSKDTIKHSVSKGPA